GYHRELFEKALEDHSGEPVSGLLLLYSGRICHVVESCSSIIHFIIRDFASLQNQGQSALLQDIKVLVVAHNIPTRLFPDWNVVAATSPEPHPQGLAQQRPTAELVAECLAFLLRAAASVHSSEGNSENTSENIPTLSPELLVPANTIDSLYRTEECLSPEDYLRMYLSPLQPALDS
ncbi:TEX47 protein, partial [Ceuthmochares aereus]|nr:TEX47 protein [Ceuthmochares aereus]